MHAGPGGLPFIKNNNHLAACYSYVNGIPAWKRIHDQKSFEQINSALLLLKNILSADKKQISFPNNESLTKKIKTLTDHSRSLFSYSQQKMIESALLEISRNYQKNQPLFSRQLLHPNANLTNFLFYKKTAYTLDLSHVRHDYILSDLSSLVISSIFFNAPKALIESLVYGYFAEHKLKNDRLIVLVSLIRTGLIHEYLKNIVREKSLETSIYPLGQRQIFLSQLSIRKKSITSALERINYTHPSFPAKT